MNFLRIFWSLFVILASLYSTDGYAHNMSVRINPFYSHDYLRWNFSNRVINIRSELTWRKMHVVGFDLEYDLVYAKKNYFDIVIRYGSIVGGELQDSDYNASNRTKEFLRAYADTGGYVVSTYLGFGKIVITNDILRLIPQGGIFFRRGSYLLRNGYQAINTIGKRLGPFEGLKSHYENNWIGGFGGFKLSVRPVKIWTLDLILRGSLSYYYASADWNLRKDFQHPISYEQHAIGFGSSIELMNLFRVYNNIYISFGSLVEVMYVPIGLMVVYYSEQSRFKMRLSSYSQIREVISFSASAYIGLKVVF